MDAWVFAAGVVSVTGAAIVQGGFAYVLERRRSRDSARDASLDAHLSARVSYRVIFAELVHDHAVLEQSIEDGRWWGASLAPRTIDWIASRDTCAHHLETGGLYRDLSLTYTQIEILLASHPAPAAPTGPSLSDEERVGFAELMQNIVRVLEGLDPLVT